MNKKCLIALCFIFIVALTLFCGCSKEVEDTSITSTASQGTVTEETTSVTDSNDVTDGTQYKPEHTDDDELEIMTIPPNADTQESNPPQSATDAPQRETENNNQSETKIELPFVPVQ